LDNPFAEAGTIQYITLKHRRQGWFGLGYDGRAGLQLRPEGSFIGADQSDGTGVSHRRGINSGFSVNLATHESNSCENACNHLISMTYF
jgi:hypothetical protein